MSTAASGNRDLAHLGDLTIIRPQPDVAPRPPVVPPPDAPGHVAVPPPPDAPGHVAVPPPPDAPEQVAILVPRRPDVPDQVVASEYELPPQHQHLSLPALTLHAELHHWMNHGGTGGRRVDVADSIFACFLAHETVIRLSAAEPLFFALQQHSPEDEISPQIQQLLTDHSYPTLEAAIADKTLFLQASTESKILNLSNQGVSTLPNLFKKLPLLVKLEVDRNVLVSLPDSIGELSNLEHFNCSVNLLDQLPPGIANLSKLKKLDCKNNVNVQRSHYFNKGSPFYTPPAEAAHQSGY